MSRAVHLALLALWLAAAAPAWAQVGWPPFQAALTPGIADSEVAARLPEGSGAEPPPAGLDPAQAAFAGRWEGWAGRGRSVEVVLAVERLASDGAVLALGLASEARGAYAFRGPAAFRGSELHAALDDGRRIALRLRPDGNLDFLLVAADEAQKPAAQVAWAAGVLWRGFPGLHAREMLPADRHENGRPLRLDTRLFRPREGARFPLLVINHGSTGRGTDPRLFRDPVDSAVLAAHFVQRGWMVAFPARRGRGRSDGDYAEGFGADRARGYSCEAALSLPGMDRALADIGAAVRALKARPEVDAGRLVMAGISRGGILSVAYAGAHPQEVRGVINFVGGWLGEGCAGAGEVNRAGFQRGARFPAPMLWLYGEGDSFYSIAHSRANFAAFEAAGGRGLFQAYALPGGGNGHWLHAHPTLWARAVDGYLAGLGLP